MFDTAKYDQKMNHGLEHYQHELKKIRTGRAHAGMLDGIMVEAYGALMPLNQVANVTAPEASLLQVTPFDPSNIQAIAGAIRKDQSLGFNPSDDGRVVRVPVPPLTEERRLQLVKQVGEKVEDARIAMRTVRQDALKDIKRLKDYKQIGEDDQKRFEKEIDDLVAKTQSKIDEIAKEKEKDLLVI